MTHPALPKRLQYLDEMGVIEDPDTGWQTDAPEFPGPTRARTVELDSAFAAELVRRYNAEPALREWIEGVLEADSKVPFLDAGKRHFARFLLGKVQK